MSPAATWNLVTDQGKTFTRSLRYGVNIGGVFTPTDNTGMEARMQVRRTIPSADVVLDLSSTAGDIILGGMTGEITWTVTAEDMEALVGKYAYDLELVDTSGPDDVVYGIVRGSLTVRGEVTR